MTGPNFVLTLQVIEKRDLNTQRTHSTEELTVLSLLRGLEPQLKQMSTTPANPTELPQFTQQNSISMKMGVSNQKGRSFHKPHKQPVLVSLTHDDEIQEHSHCLVFCRLTSDSKANFPLWSAESNELL